MNQLYSTYFGYAEWEATADRKEIMKEKIQRILKDSTGKSYGEDIKAWVSFFEEQDQNK